MTAVDERPTLLPGSDEWLSKMTASKVAAMLGLSPYESRFSLWHRMARLIPQQPDSDILRRGHYLEPAIVAWFADQHPDWQIQTGGSWIHPDNPSFAASPDRMLRVDGELRSLEVKSAADTDEWGEPGTDQIPAGYRAQCVWEMDCTGTKVCHVAVLSAYLEFNEYVISYDPDEAAFIRTEAQAFLDSLPTGPSPQRPDIDRHNATYDAVRQLHPLIDGTDVELDPELVALYCSSKHALKAAEEAETYAKSLLADELGLAKRGRYLGRTIAQRQAKGGGIPYLVAGRNLPTFDQEATS